MKDEARPVADWENTKVKGDALASKRNFDTHLTKVTELRERQQAYEESLPKDPQEAMMAILTACPAMGDFTKKSFAARAALEILHEFATRDVFEDCQTERMKQTLYWLTSQGLDGIDAIERGTSQVRDIAHQFHPSHEPYRA